MFLGRFFLAPNNLTDHSPFEKSEGDNRSKQERLNGAAEEIKSWLIEAGIPESSIEIASYWEDEGENWFVADRHTKDTLGGVRDIKKMRKLFLPITDFYTSARDQGLINMNPEDLEKALEQKIKERLGARS